MFIIPKVPVLDDFIATDKGQRVLSWIGLYIALLTTFFCVLIIENMIPTIIFTICAGYFISDLNRKVDK